MVLIVFIPITFHITVSATLDMQDVGLEKPVFPGCQAI